MTKNSYQFIPAGSVDIFTAIKKGLTARPKAEFFLFFFLAPCKKRVQQQEKTLQWERTRQSKTKENPSLQLKGYRSPYRITILLYINVLECVQDSLQEHPGASWPWCIMVERQSQ